MRSAGGLRKIGMTELIVAQGNPTADTLRFASDFACAAAPEQSN